MTRYEKLRYEMFLRVRDFGAAHREQFPDGSMGGNAFRAVEAAIADVEAHATTKVLTAEEGKQAKTAARDALVDRLATIARTARLIAKSVPGADAAFQLPDNSSDLALLTAARAAIREAEAAIDRFVLLGMPTTFVADLQALVDNFEQAMHGRRAGRTGLAAAQAGLRAAMAQGMDAIRTLDVVVFNTLKDDPVLLAIWKRDRRVDPKTKGTTAAVVKPAAGPTPAPGPVPAPSPMTAAGPVATPTPVAAAEVAPPADAAVEPVLDEDDRRAS